MLITKGTLMNVDYKRGVSQGYDKGGMSVGYHKRGVSEC